MSQAPPTIPWVSVGPAGRRRRRVPVLAVAAVAALLATGALVLVALLRGPVGPSAYYLPEPVPPVTHHPTAPTGAPEVGPTGHPPAPRTSARPAPVPSRPSTTTSAVPTKGNPHGRPTDLPPRHTR